MCSCTSEFKAREKTMAFRYGQSTRQCKIKGGVTWKDQVCSSWTFFRSVCCLTRTPYL
uniref:Uncharacterized protein n=1 Tax=Tetraselmis sp. GSL018 TaxID=582737 RepID=A0A061QTE1_9CHLO